jgi:hypothetical protein
LPPCDRQWYGRTASRESDQLFSYAWSNQKGLCRGKRGVIMAKKCQPCEADGSEKGNTKSSRNYGVFFLAMPVVTTVLIWLWVGRAMVLSANTLWLIMDAPGFWPMTLLWMIGYAAYLFQRRYTNRKSRTIMEEHVVFGNYQSYKGADYQLVLYMKEVLKDFLGPCIIISPGGIEKCPAWDEQHTTGGAQ